MTPEHKRVLCGIIKHELRHNVAKVKFLKASTGEVSEHVGTLMSDEIKEYIGDQSPLAYDENAPKKKTTEPSEESVSFFSITAIGWRSFRWDNLINFHPMTEEEIKEYKNGKRNSPDKA